MASLSHPADHGAADTITARCCSTSRLDDSLGPDKWRVWYANVAASDSGVIKLTMRLDAPADETPASYPIAEWKRPDFEKFERLALATATRKIKAASCSTDPADLDSSALADTWISVSLLKIR